MARERYLIDSSEDTIHSNQIVLTDKKDIRKNWWHYHKMIIFGIVIAVAVVCSFVYSILSKEKPDYYVALLTSTNLPEDLIAELEDYLELYADDRTQDGEVLVRINAYVIGDPNTDTVSDPNLLQAAMVRFTADASSGDSLIYLHDEKTFNHLASTGLEGFFRYNDGTPMPDTANDYDKAMLPWQEVEALADFKPQSLTSDTVSQEDILKILERYRLSFRNRPLDSDEKEEKAEYYQKSDEFYKRLIKNEKWQQNSKK